MPQHIDQVIVDLICPKEVITKAKKNSLNRPVPCSLNSRVKVLDQVLVKSKTAGKFKKDPIVTHKASRVIGKKAIRTTAPMMNAPAKMIIVRRDRPKPCLSD